MTITEANKQPKTAIETFKGEYVDMNNLTPDPIEIESIAHALGNICRYNGHCLNYYSVAEHAVFVSKRLERKGYNRMIQLAGLHHDDAEAFLGDIPRPLKPLLGSKYEELTDAVDEAICRALNMPFGPEAFHWHEVKDADDWSLFVEARNLLPSQGKGWSVEPKESRIIVPDYYLNGVEPRAATKLYLARHKEIVQ